MKSEYNIRYLDESRCVVENIILGAENVLEAKSAARREAEKMGIKYAYISAKKGTDHNAYERAQRKRRADPRLENNQPKTFKLLLPMTEDLHQKILAISALTGAGRSKVVYEPLRKAVEEVYNSMFLPTGGIRKELSFKKQPKLFIAHVENGTASLDFDEETDYPYHVYVKISASDYKRIKEVFEAE